MNKKIFTVFITVLLGLACQCQGLVLKKGITIRRSATVKKAIYALDGFDSLHRAAIIIEGNNIVIDFANATMKGSQGRGKPDEFFGVAVIVRNARNVTIKNLTAKGYKVALLARNVDGLKVENCDFSYNYRQHLNSTQEKEDLSDWMSYHQNESDQWLRYGAAIYLSACKNFKVTGCRVTGGQNALMLTGCSDGLVYNNDFSFNSGIGIGLYRSSGNRIMYNRINFNVRGYSHGVYSRGQDSAGILVYEQSNKNVFYKNSVTHGGDGFFLWAGQTTMDTGAGGCNDNRIIENDFSYAPTNGIEVTFSRNQIIGNRIFECDHGIWGGYSFSTLIAKNQFRNNRIAIAIEHGQHNSISQNIFYKDKEAIRLWSRPQQPKDWGYAKYRDTRSAAYLINVNSFNQNPLVYDLSGTDSLNIFGNRYSFVDGIFKKDSTVRHIDSIEVEVPDLPLENYDLKGGMDVFKGNGRMAGRKNIMVTEWGPYDFRYPLIWNTNPSDTTGLLLFDVLGPKGKWKLVSVKGLELKEMAADTFPVKLSAVRLPALRTDVEIIAEYTGPAFTDPFGATVKANQPYRFSFRKFFQPLAFSVSFYDFDSLTNPVHTPYLERVKTQRPFRIESADQLEYAWWGGIKTGETVHQQFLTIAEGGAELDAGDYELSVTWDDAVRVYVDGKLLIDEWNPSLYRFDESPNKKIVLKLQKGYHGIRVEHVELGGFATLGLKLNKVPS